MPNDELLDAPLADEPEEIEMAGFGSRFVAGIFDQVIAFFMLIVIWGLILLVLQLVRAYERGGFYDASWAFTALPWVLLPSLILYRAFYESSKLQATPGKTALALYVVNEYGGRLSFGQALIRNILRLASFVAFPFFIISIWTSRKQALHDLLVGSLVVRRPQKPGRLKR